VPVSQEYISSIYTYTLKMEAVFSSEKFVDYLPTRLPAILTQMTTIRFISDLYEWRQSSTHSKADHEMIVNNKLHAPASFNPVKAVERVLMKTSRKIIFFFSTAPRPVLGAHPASFPVGTGSSFSRVKKAGVWC
jgi:hypothetical protein